MNCPKGVAAAVRPPRSTDHRAIIDVGAPGPDPEKPKAPKEGVGARVAGWHLLQFRLAELPLGTRLASFAVSAGLNSP